MGFSLIPKEIQFFDLFDKQAEIITIAAAHFREMAEKGQFDDANIEKMSDIEHSCDLITHDIIDKLNRCFITPFDREDIYALAHELDDLVDMIYSVSKRMRMYKLNTVNKDMVQFSLLIQQSSCALAKALSGLRHSKHHKACHKACHHPKAKPEWRQTAATWTPACPNRWA